MRLCLLALLFVGCTRDPERSPGAVAITPIAVADVLPPTEHYLGVGLVPDGTLTRALDGSVRAEIAADGSVKLADDRFATPLRTYVHLNTGWVFVSADGVVATSATYLGPLRRIGQAQPDDSYDPTGCRGRLAFIGDGVETTDGGPLEPLPALPRGVIAHVAFRDHDHGVVLVESGDAFLTDDGGRTYRKLALGDAIATRARCRDDTLVLDTLQGPRRIDGGRLVPVAELPRAAVDWHLEDRMRAAELLKFGPVEGRFVAVVSAKAAPAVVPLDSLSLDMVTALLRDKGLCPIRRWGGAYALLCPEGLYRYEPSTLGTKLIASKDWAAHPYLVLGADGQGAAWHCDDYDQRISHLCVTTAQGVVKREIWPTAMLDGRLVFWRGNAMALVDPTTGGEQMITVPLPAGTARFDSLRIGSDASVIGIAGSTAVRMRWPSQKSMWITLPAGATALDFIDARRGVARGVDATTLWATADGGASWQAIAPRLDGTYHDHRRREEQTSSLACDFQHCTVDDRIVVTFAPTSPAVPVLGAIDRSAAQPPRFDDDWLTCAIASTRKIAERGRGEDYLLDSRGRTEIARDNLFATLAVRPGKPRETWSVSWEGRDVLGTYRASGSADVRAAHDIREYQVHRATRDGIAIRADDSYWIPAGGTAVRIEGVDELLPAPNGELAVLFQNRVGDDHWGIRIVVRDRHGAVIATRDVPYNYRPMRLGWLDGKFIVQTLEEDGRQRSAIAITGTRDPIALHDDWFTAPICTRAHPRPSLMLATTGRVTFDPYGRVIERIAVDTTAAPCIAAVVFAGDDGNQVTATAALDGTLVTEFERGDELSHVSCRRK